MPILQEINDPYYASTASTLGGMADGMIGNPAKSQAEAIALANQVQLNRAQQQRLEQQMRLDQQKADQENQKFGWEQAAHKRADDLATSARRYYEVQPVAPVNGTPEEMERYYRAQDFYGQAGAGIVGAGKGAQDLAQGIDQYSTTLQSQYPAQQTASNDPLTYHPQRAPAGLTAEGRKVFDTEEGKRAQKFYQNQAEAPRLLEDALRAREAYRQAQGYIGPLQGSTPYNVAQSMNPFGQNGVQARSDLDSKLAAYQRGLIMQNLPPGPASNTDVEQARKGMASISDRSATAGLESIDRDITQILSKQGYRVDAAAVHGLMEAMARGDNASVQQFMQSTPGGEQIARTVYSVLAPLSAQPQPTQAQPPVPGARQAPDGQWYVTQQNGQNFRVEQ